MRVELWAGAASHHARSLHPVWDHPTGWVKRGVVASHGCSVLSLCVCLWLSTPPQRGGRSSWSQMVLCWAFASTEMEVAGFIVLTEGKWWAREEFLWYTVQLLKTSWGFKSPFLWLLNPPTISDFSWGSIHRQNSAGHIGFVVMTIVQRRVPTCRKSFLHCFKADKATMGVLGIPSSRLSSLARCSKILRYLQSWARPQVGTEASCFLSREIPPSRENPLLLLCSCLSVVQPLETYYNMTRGWTDVKASTCYRLKKSIMLTYLPPLLYFSLWFCSSF